MSEKKVVPIPTHVSASIDKDGRARPAHLAVRHKSVTFTEDVGHEYETPLDLFIAKHGGPAHLRETLERMEGHERAKLLDAMAHVEGTDAAAVMKKLGIHEPEKSELLTEQAAIEAAKEGLLEKLGGAKTSGVISEDEHATLIGILERDGVGPALEAARAMRAPDVAQTGAPPPPASTEAPAAATSASEGAAGLRAALLAQADEMYERHVETANRLQATRWQIEKRNIRRWTVSEALLEEEKRYEEETLKYLQAWRDFCTANGLNDALS